MDAFTQYDAKDYGTAYGMVEKSFRTRFNNEKSGYTPAIVVIGDLENEGAVEKQINWNTLPSNVSKVKQYAPDLAMMFLGAHPEKLDKVKETLTPVLGEQKLIISPEQTTDKAIRRFLHALGR